jgi:hypothetical protein
MNPADAHLIAAAPLLLAACEEVLSEDDRLGGFLSQRAYILLMAAIVKAKGE